MYNHHFLSFQQVSYMLLVQILQTDQNGLLSINALKSFILTHDIYLSK